jgi:hypothetical protein
MRTQELVEPHRSGHFVYGHFGYYEIPEKKGPDLIDLIRSLHLIY